MICWVLVGFSAMRYSIARQSVQRLPLIDIVERAEVGLVHLVYVGQRVESVVVRQRVGEYGGLLEQPVVPRGLKQRELSTLEPAGERPLDAIDLARTAVRQ